MKNKIYRRNLPSRSISLGAWCTLVIGLIVGALSCSGGKMEIENNSFERLHDVPDTVLHKLSSATIFFAHQSVGNNILDGIKEVITDHPGLSLNIREESAAGDIEKGTLTHSQIGQNRYPLTKIDALAQIVSQGIGEKADLILFKMCYIDISPATATDKLFVTYKQTMTDLQRQFPRARFIHFTVPLETTQKNLKYYIKRGIGRMDANIPRNRFNSLLREEYGNSGNLFDLAKVESTYPDGSRSTFTARGKTYDSLVPEYTYDSGHLNALGRKIVAEQLLVHLCRLLQ